MRYVIQTEHGHYWTGDRYTKSWSSDLQEAKVFLSLTGLKTSVGWTHRRDPVTGSQVQLRDPVPVVIAVKDPA